MQKGFNSDLSYQGESYHVQTEDWGNDNPFFVSHVFKSGAVLRRVKVPYAEVLPRVHMKNTQAIRLAMQFQHQKILDLLISGQLF